jgi:hypothetical protein
MVLTFDFLLVFGGPILDGFSSKGKGSFLNEAYLQDSGI